MSVGTSSSCSITSSARASGDGGMVRPSTLAVATLITNSNLVGRITGRSADLHPCEYGSHDRIHSEQPIHIRQTRNSFGGERGRFGNRDNHGHLTANQVRGVFGQSVVVTLGRADFQAYERSSVRPRRRTQRPHLSRRIFISRSREQMLYSENISRHQGAYAILT
jgi:hypothetical protein